MKVNFSDFFIEQLLIFFSSIFFDFTVLSIINDLSSNGISFLYPYVFSITFFTGILNLVIFKIFSIEKVSLWAFVRYLVILMATTTGIGLLISKIRGIHMVSLFIFISVLITFLYMEFINKPVSCHERFIHQCENKSGTALSQELYHDNVNALDFAQSAKSCSLSSSVFMFLLCFLVIGIEQSRLKVSILTYIFLILHIVFTLSILLLFNIYNKESFFAFLGFEKIFSFRFFIGKLSVLICLIAGVTAFFVSSDKALIKFERLPIEFKTEESSAPVINSQPENYDYVDIPNMKGFSEMDDKPIISENFWIVLKYLFIAAIITGFLIFMIKPFISKKWTEYFKNRKLIQLIKSFNINFRMFIKNLFSGKLFHKVNYSKMDVKSFSDSMNIFIKNSKKSREKKAELDRLSKIFVKLIEWGNENNFRYEKNLAPLEYVQMMNNKSAEMAGLLFEKALYAKELLTENEEKLFKQYVNEVIQ